MGLLRAVGDGLSILYIQDILVLPAYQRKGIGRALVERCLEKFSHVRQNVLMTDNTEKTLAFYKALGFTPTQDIDCQAFMKIHNSK